MSLKKELDKLKFDKRLTGYHLNRGKLKKEELEAHLASLEDNANNVYNEEDDDLDNPGDFGDGNEGVDDTNMTDDADTDQDNTGGDGSQQP